MKDSKFEDSGNRITSVQRFDQDTWINIHELNEV